jgi:hypothetical protein
MEILKCTRQMSRTLFQFNRCIITSNIAVQGESLQFNIIRDTRNKLLAHLISIRKIAGRELHTNIYRQITFISNFVLSLSNLISI